MKYEDIHHASLLQADLRTELANLTKFRALMFSDKARTAFNARQGNIIRCQIVAPDQGYLDVMLDPEDQIFLDIEKRIIVRVREGVERLARLGVSITFEEVLPNG